MSRTPRNALVVSGETYHVIARGNNRMKIFHEHGDYTAYLEMVRFFSRICSVSVYHYTLMPNHVHLLVRPSANLSTFMHAVQSTYAKRYCKRKKHVGHIWQGRYKSLHIASDPYLFACGNYIEMNPVRAKLVAQPEDWPYSSYRAYALGYHDRLVTIDPFYPSLGSTDKERRDQYRDLIAKTRSNQPVPLVPGTGD